MLVEPYNRRWRAEHPYGVYPETSMSPHERRQFQIRILSVDEAIKSRFPGALGGIGSGLSTKSSDPVERRAANLARLVRADIQRSIFESHATERRQRIEDRR